MLTRRIRDFLERHQILPCRIVVACSGGFDSTALLLAAAELREYRVACAHVNHHLRGADSDADEAFVRELCARLGLPVDVADGTISAEAVRRHGLEAAAREVRESRLLEIARGDRIATAHQRDDQAETVLMRLLTGSGIGGLRGIHAVREDGFIRPLLETTRAEVESFLAERGITPRTDHSNAEPRFLRNRIRRTLREFDSAAIANLASIASQAQQIWPTVELALDRFDQNCTTSGPDETRFLSWPSDPWWRQALLHRHIRRLGTSREISSADLERLVATLDAIRRVSVTKDLELIRRDKILILRRSVEPTPDFELELRADAEAYIPEIGKIVRIRRSYQPPTTNNQQHVQLPPGSAATFVIRNRRDGDRFQPLGMPRDKKLKDFLIDRKIPVEIRDSIPLLLWNDQIVWVAGIEISERFKVTSPGEGELYEVMVESREDHEEVQR